MTLFTNGHALAPNVPALGADIRGFNGDELHGSGIAKTSREKCAKPTNRRPSAFRGVLSSVAALSPLAVLTAAVCSVTGCGGPKAAPAIPSPEVEVASVVQKDVPIVSEWFRLFVYISKKSAIFFPVSSMLYTVTLAPFSVPERTAHSRNRLSDVLAIP